MRKWIVEERKLLNVILRCEASDSWTVFVQQLRVHRPAVAIRFLSKTHVVVGENTCTDASKRN